MIALECQLTGDEAGSCVSTHRKCGPSKEIPVIITGKPWHFLISILSIWHTLLGKKESIVTNTTLQAADTRFRNYYCLHCIDEDAEAREVSYLKSHGQQAANLAPESIPNTSAILPLECLWLLCLDGDSCFAAWIIVQIGFPCSTHPCLCPIPRDTFPLFPAVSLHQFSLPNPSGVWPWPASLARALPRCPHRCPALYLIIKSRNWDLDSMSWKPMMLEEAKWVHGLSLICSCPCFYSLARLSHLHHPRPPPPSPPQHTHTFVFVLSGVLLI